MVEFSSLKPENNIPGAISMNNAGNSPGFFMEIQ